MTQEFFLPDDLLELERELAGSRAPVDPAVVSRTLNAVRRELLIEQSRQQRRRMLAAVAVFVIGTHFAWWRAVVPWNSHRAAIDRAQLADCAAHLQALAPELSASEAQRQARLALLSRGRESSSAGSFALPRPLGSKLTIE